MRAYEFLDLNETASSGTTCAGNVASINQPIKKKSVGSGFDPDGDRGIYQSDNRVVLVKRKAIN